jgi:exopolysaccharide production protein ExoZ
MSQQNSSLNSIQYLRCFAIFSVFFLHLNTKVTIGHFGVDIFFVISGYVMALLASKNTDPSKFIKDRIFRIVPLYWATTLVVFILAVYFGDKMLKTSANIESLLLSLAFIPFYKFETEITPLYAIGWTLMFEMLFYVAMFIALLYKKHIDKSVNPLVFSFILVASLTFFASLTNKHNPYLQFMGSQNSYVFLYGIIIYWLNTAKFIQNISRPNWYYLTALALAVLYCMAGEVYLMPYRALSVGIPAFLIVFIATRIEYDSNIAMPLKIKSALLYIAEISYAFYLTHILVIMGMKRVLAQKMPALAPDTLFGAMLALVIALVVAVITHHIFDKPVNGFLKQQFIGNQRMKLA